MGDAVYSCLSSFRLEELVGELFFKCLEYGTGDIERPIELLKTSLARTLFEWSCIWGLTHCISLSDFLISVRSTI